MLQGDSLLRVDDETLTATGGKNENKNNVDNVYSAAIKWIIPKATARHYVVYGCEITYNNGRNDSEKRRNFKQRAMLALTGSGSFDTSSPTTKIDSGKYPLVFF